MALKLHFEPDLAFQRDAIAAVVDLFRGQEVTQSQKLQAGTTLALWSQSRPLATQENLRSLNVERAW